ncbi:hypothetical protein [Micromonospora sp. WMMD1082]|uniref:hypothetical protein n=1 Tax=Micromonospora sp. WMMD1082 TaxID=3016104 RepID=UPI002415A69D|nr:hypothetical protein [Micromonospora sp. WMMD1082]MDG4797047.1 hypothetical protein [Micromonospora sp. WMMD1082]
MLVEVAPHSTDAELVSLGDRIAGHEDVTAWPVRLAGRCFLVVAGDERLVTRVPSAAIRAWHSTADRGYWLVDRANALLPERVPLGTGHVGGGGWWCGAGPCALESVPDTVRTASLVRRAGADAVRASLFKVRSGPYHFPGKGRAGLPALAEVRAAGGLPVITEVVDPRDVEPVAQVADCLQVDPRNMTNRALLTELGGCGRPVLLMRGVRATVVEWLRAAEYVVSHGNPHVVMCARGVVSFDRSLAYQLDYGAVAAVRRHTHLPVIFDPSHSTGSAAAVAPAALAAAVFGVDGLLVETHPAPERMYRPGDAAQMYPVERLRPLLAACRRVRDLAASLTA